MLTREEREEIDAEIATRPTRASAAIDALRIVQRHRSWISDESLREVAEYLAMSVAALDSVATFYNLIYRRPVGRHVVRICDSVVCWMMGEEAVRAASGLAFGETSTDDRFTVLPAQCLGICDRAPALLIDDDLHVGVSPADLAGILASYK